MRLLIDKTKRILKILEPITFPIAISPFFFVAATTEVTNSGNDVPAATIDQSRYSQNNKQIEITASNNIPKNNVRIALHRRNTVND